MSRPPFHRSAERTAKRFNRTAQAFRPGKVPSKSALQGRPTATGRNAVQGRTPQSTATVFSQEITTSLEPVMRRQFSGDTLTLCFTDIDLGGPRPAGRPGSVRVLRPSNAARLSFDYILQDRAGRKVGSGTERLVDSLQRTLARYPSNSRPLYFEGQMLRNWLRSLSVTR